MFTYYHFCGAIRCAMHEEVVEPQRVFLGLHGHSCSVLRLEVGGDQAGLCAWLGVDNLKQLWPDKSILDLSLEMANHQGLHY